MLDKDRKWSSDMTHIQIVQILSFERLLDTAYKMKELAETDETIQDIDGIIQGLKDDIEIIKTRPVSLEPITGAERQNALNVAKIITKNQIRKIDVDVIIE